MQVRFLPSPQMNVTITLPIEQDKIKGEVDKLLVLVNEKRKEVDTLFTLVDAIRKLCEHKYDKGCSTCNKCRHDYD